LSLLQRCISTAIFNAQSKEDISDELAPYICGFLLLAASDITAATSTAFIKAMVLCPNVQQVAQAEVDKICGYRMPSPGDHNGMLYIHALIKEVCCWMPAARLGIPHANNEDDEYKGYKIPKNTMVIMNV
jgi:cytochrome P450